MGKKSGPKQPDPAATASAQGSWNSFTAQQQQAMNQTSQVTPYGNLTYTQTGSTSLVDPNGKTIWVPQYTANTTLSPSQQAIFDQTQAADLNLASIANQQSQKIGSLLNTPFEAPKTLSNQDVENWAYDLGSSRLIPQQQQNEAALRSQLINAGLRPGTPQWDSEMTRLTQANTDQLNQLALTGRTLAVNEQQQAFNQALQARNQPLNEIIGLTSGTQIQNPNASFVQTPQSQVGGVDYAGQVNQNYQAQLQQYNARTGALGGALGGLFGMFKFSDARMKTDIKRVGRTDAGTPIYSYRYLSGGPVEFGVMAQDILHAQPEAVAVHESGAYMVDYGKVK